MVDSVKQTDIETTILDLQNFGTRYEYTTLQDSAGVYLYNKFQNMGFPTSYDSYIISLLDFFGVSFVGAYTCWVVGVATLAELARPIEIGISSDEDRQLEKTVLLQNFPNPFSTSTKFRYYLLSQMPITLTIHDIGGRVVRTFKNSGDKHGWHTLFWDREDNCGEKARSGIYFLVFKGRKFTETQKMVTLK